MLNVVELTATDVLQSIFPQWWSFLIVNFSKGGTVRMARKTHQQDGRKRYVTGYSQDGYTHITIYPVRNKTTKKNKKK